MENLRERLQDSPLDALSLNMLLAGAEALETSKLWNELLGCNTLYVKNKIAESYPGHSGFSVDWTYHQLRLIHLQGVDFYLSKLGHMTE